jgi:hypothetical protein
MAIITRTSIKSNFETGDIPTQAQFSDWIDSSLFYEDSGTVGVQILAAETTAAVASLLDTVAGPASSTDDSLAKFDGVTGRLLKDGAIIGTDVQAYDADTLKADTDDTLTGGFGGTDASDGTKSSGTYTPTYAGGNFKTAVNGGAHTLAPQSGTGTLIVQYTNDGSAGAITTSGFTVVTGDDLTTTNGDDFMCYLTVVSTFSQLHVVALQ